MVQIYDIEVFPNFFCIGFEDYSSDKRWSFEISSRRDQRSELLAFVLDGKGKYYVGYNNGSYDNPILNYVLLNKVTPADIYKVSQMIINEQRKKPHSFEYKKFKKKYLYIKTPYISIDLMTLHASKKGRVSLKEMEVSMCWHKVQDLPYKFDTPLTEEQMDEVIEYNFNDIGATKQLCKIKQEDINLRLGIKKKFGLDCLSSDNVNLGVELFAKMYEDKVGDSSFRDARTYRPSIALGDCILDKVQFKSKKFNDLLTKMKKAVITQTKGALDYEVNYGGVLHVYGTGGIHSKDRAAKVKPPKGYVYIDADVNKPAS